ncbi:ATP synthase subunit I [Rhodocista pekingensis]|uniref:ATP synthase subunit I n=1 Tax=Rhodocista pekingensis TaxID=201185 RepID=A0ABW2KTA3_9PROT
MIVLAQPWMPTALMALAALAAGLAGGIVYFRALRLNARLWLAGRGVVLPLLLHAGRLLLAGGLFVLAAQAGAAALLAGFAGFLAARRLTVRPGVAEPGGVA